MDESGTKLTELQFVILDCMVDDYEDIEQLYLCANRQTAEEHRLGTQFPLKIISVSYPLREIVDEVACMLEEGYVVAKYSNDEKVAPLESVNSAALHHYWFGPTQKGTEAWQAHHKRQASAETNR